MTEIRSIVARVARRLFLARLTERVTKALFWLAVLVVLLLAVDKVVPFGPEPWLYPVIAIPLA